MFEQRTKQGAYFALAAYGFWGLAPLYFKFLAHVSPLEILCHRVVWSVLLLLGILAYMGDMSALRIGTRKLALCLLTALLLSANWLIFISAIVENNIIEASLGYFINPLVSVFLGMIFLRETLRPLQWIAVAIAAMGIGFQVVSFGVVPWISLSLAFSFGFYGLIRKRMNLHSVAGLTIETLMLLPAALLFLSWIYVSGEMSFGYIDTKTTLLLMLGGIVTSFPLLCFGAAVSRLSLTAAGMFQYLAPTLSLIVAVGVYDEAFSIERQITFGFIWVALLVFSFETFHHHRKVNRRLKQNLFKAN
ncbi:MAG: chloramphenicol-sensitive protein RarD [Candidatus Pseudothioglobus sp.]|jgi:chloramphenicol-sensitive protein RarD